MRTGLAGLPAHKDELLRLTGRLVVHCENASDRLFREGELTAEGDVRQLVPRIIELVKHIRENVIYIDGDGSDPAADLAALFAHKDGDGA